MVKPIFLERKLNKNKTHQTKKNPENFSGFYVYEFKALLSFTAS